MKKRRRRSRKKSPTPHRRRRRAAAHHHTKRRHHRRRRRNPGFPSIVKTAVGVGIGAGAGAAVSFGVDKLNMGTPQHRNLAIIGAGVAAAVLLGKMVSAETGLAVGGGIASVGLTRAVANAMNAALPTSQAVHGLGTGEGYGDGQVEGPFDQIGAVYPRPDINGAFDDIGLVVNDYS